LSITSPVGGSDLAGGATLTGTVNAGSAAITALSYAFDGGTTMPVSFDAASGAFDVGLDLARLAVGAHTLTGATQDGAGNTASATVSVNLPATIPFTVTDATPTDGASDVGVTFRPKVVFSRPVDPASLTSGDFFLSGPTGDKLPAAIVPAADGSFAWLF